jgi:hypothetical protein
MQIFFNNRTPHTAHRAPRTAHLISEINEL